MTAKDDFDRYCRDVFEREGRNPERYRLTREESVAITHDVMGRSIPSGTTVAVGGNVIGAKVTRMVNHATAGSVPLEVIEPEPVVCDSCGQVLAPS